MSDRDTYDPIPGLDDQDAHAPRPELDEITEDVAHALRIIEQWTKTAGVYAVYYGSEFTLGCNGWTFQQRTTLAHGTHYTGPLASKKIPASVAAGKVIIIGHHAPAVRNDALEQAMQSLSPSELRTAADILEAQGSVE